MIGLLLYFLFGYSVIKYERPVHFAAAYVATSSLLALIFGDGLIEVLFAGAILFAYTSFVYMVVDRYGDKIFAPLGVLLAGAVILIGAAFVL